MSSLLPGTPMRPTTQPVIVSQFVALFHSLGDGVFDSEAQRELDALFARRRRGVRRGRRVCLRAIRSLTRLRARCEAVTAILQTGGL